MSIARIIVALIFIACGGFFICANWLGVFMSVRTKRNYSAVPLIGALFLARGLALIPTRFFWIAFPVDYGTWTLLIGIPYILIECWKTGEFNLISEYEYESSLTTARVRLYRNNVVVIARQFVRPKPGHCLSASTVGTWHADGQSITFSVNSLSSSGNLAVEGASELLTLPGELIDEGAEDMRLVRKR